MTEPPRPVAASERIELLDILRGVAILGVFVMILMGPARYQPKGFGEATDFVVANKALSLLSMVFGIGFGVQMFRAETRGRAFLWVYIRRMTALFALGMAHWVLIFGNTILISYAVIGCTLLLLRRLPVWSIIVTAGLLLTVLQFQGSILRSIPRVLGQDAQQVTAARNARQALVERRDAARKGGTYAEVVSLNVQTFRSAHTGVFQWIRIVFPAYYLPMAVLGLAIVKSALLQQLREKRRFVKTVMWCALAVGLASNPLPYLPLGKLPVPNWTYRLSFLLSGPSLALFYACAVALAVQTERGRKVLSWLRWPGRMALTNYVVLTAIVVVIYYGFGFGQMGKLTVPHAWAIAAVLFPLLALLSAAWLRRFEFGPLEWLWRTLTYGRLGAGRAPAVRAA